jgi:hypothetical protein
MKTFLTIIICLSLTACGNIRDYELDRLAELCGGYKEIKKVEMLLTGMWAVCNNDDYVNIKD